MQSSNIQVNKLKLEVISHVKIELNKKIEQAIIEVKQLNDSLFLESKSSAGDKHETARAMIQIEIERASKILIDLENLVQINLKIPQYSEDKIGLGSLFKTNLGWFYLAIPLGKIKVEFAEVFCLSPNAPISKLFLQKKANDEIQDKKYIIEKIL